MKRMVVPVLCAVGSVWSAERWTKPQADVLRTLDHFTEVMRSGADLRPEGVMASGFTAWYFASPAPMDQAAFFRLLADRASGGRSVECTLTPLSIRVDRGLAVAHGTGTMEAAEVGAVPAAANWTAVLVRRGGAWRVVSWSWADDGPPADAGRIREEVSRVMKDFMTACERCDLEAAWSHQSAGPEYSYVNIQGTRSDAAGTRKAWAEFFAACQSMNHATAREEVHVLGPNSAVLTWQGSAGSVMKNGVTLRFDPTSSVAVFRRTAGRWKIVHLQDSSSRPAASPPPESDASPPSSKSRPLRD
jgi:ketosteroid isomerase-like protein